MKRFLHLFTLLFCLAVTFGSSSQILDGGFETGPGSGFWVEASTNFGTPLCDLSTCGNGGGDAVPNNGDWFAWFGGANAIEVGSVEQSATVPSGTTAILEMMVKIGSTGTGTIDDKMEVFVDGSVVKTITSVDSSSYANYTIVSIDISSISDDMAHTFKIEGTQSSANVFNIYVDDVVLVIDNTPVLTLFDNPSEVNLKVYPNPVNDILNIISSSEVSEVSIISLDGKVISNNIVNGTNVSVNVSDLISGVYLYEVISLNGLFRDTFIKK